MPSELTPRITAALTTPLPGRVAPGGAKAVRAPGSAFGAPQITENFRSGSLTRQSLFW
jgi:hypothetical protein